MYEKHFGLKQKPFFKVHEHKFLYQSNQHRELMARLHFGIMEKEMVVVTGDIGSGKTVSCLEFVREISSKCRVAYLFNPRLCDRDFLSEIISQLGNEQPKWYRRNLLDQLQNVVERCYDELNLQPVLLIDETQILSSYTLENIRLLTNSRMNTHKLLAIILIGQPELKRRLSLDTYEAFNQRVGMKYHLHGLSKDETFAYIKHRLKVAGGSISIFTSLAIEKIFDWSKGIPRKINKLASVGLLNAYLKKTDTVNDSIVDQSIIETN